MHIRAVHQILALLFLAQLLLPGISQAIDAGKKGEILPFLDPRAEPYRTPLSGEGFRTEVFGRSVTVEPRNRRSLSAWNLGLSFYEPAPEHSAIVPFGVFTFWRHPDDERLLSAQIAGVYNDIFRAKKFSPEQPFEWVLVFTNYTLPFAQSELVDGRSLDRQELKWGFVRPGFGVGWRTQTAPGHQDNMAAWDLLIEPGYLYFAGGSETAPDFVVPRDTWTLQARILFRVDMLERNLLELAHQGIAAGADIVSGYRRNWRNWGENGAESADDGRRYQSCTGYFLASGGIPGIPSDRHRLIGVLQAGTGNNLDRFSARRVGGGPNPVGESFGSSVSPILPGATPQEFFPSHYLLMLAEYRWEPVFFAYLGLNASFGRLDRLRLTDAGMITKTDSFTSVGTRLTTGFFFRTRLQISYNYNFDVVRDDDYGGNEIVVNVSKIF